MNSGTADPSSQLSETKRGWLSLWVVVHFFSLTVCLLNNDVSSFLIGRLHQLLVPYSAMLAQDYGARPFEMTSGQARSFPHRLQVHSLGAADDAWVTIQPTKVPVLALADCRWSNWENMLGVAATEDNEELVYILFEHIARSRAINESSSSVTQKNPDQASQPIDSVRLVRIAALSFAQNGSYREGKLPQADLEDTVLYEARVVAMSDHQIKLLPVLERARRAVSLGDKQ